MIMISLRVSELSLNEFASIINVEIYKDSNLELGLLLLLSLYDFILAGGLMLYFMDLDFI